MFLLTIVAFHLIGHPQKSAKKHQTVLDLESTEACIAICN